MYNPFEILINNLGESMNTLVVIFLIIMSLACAYRALSLIAWTGLSAIILILTNLFGWLSGGASITMWIIFLVIAIPLNIKPLRRVLLSDRFFSAFKKSLPKLSKTEETALNAGDTWIEQDLFRGAPNWERLHAIPKHTMTEDEQSFLDNETNDLCKMIDDWKVMQVRDLPEDVWTFMKEKGFFGLVIDKKYGGRGFSARAHSEIVLKIASRTGVGSVTVMVPNSLGPGELLHHYGTQEQRDLYLPRLADGREIPCFALTEPQAGSDATTLTSTGVVCKKEIDGKEVLGMNLNFNKRYITLAPVATLVGLAIELQDPEGLLNGVGEEGITCALIPRDTKGLDIGNRHFPSALPFMNGTVRGKDIFVPLDTIIGGQKMAGEGWRMLVECLSIGRAISLPALGTASSSISYVMTGAYSKLRKQFGMEIGKFEGVEELMAKISGYSYMIQASREVTVAAVDDGIKPSVASAIAKCHMTDKAREALIDAYDIHGGRAVVLGPRNYLATNYAGAPVSITVEGANIMTRNLLIFGQGAMACHPYIRKEFYAMTDENQSAGKETFDNLLWEHAGYFTRNMTRTIWTGLTCGGFISTPQSPLKGYYRKLSRMSYAFSWVSDLSLMYLGGDLKRKERLSARLGDVLANMYLVAATLKYFKDNGEQKEEMIYAQWALDFTLYEAQEALIDFCTNFPSKALGCIMRTVVLPYGRHFKAPSDKLEHQCASLAMKNNVYRDRIMKKLYLTGDPTQPMDRVECAFQQVLACEDIYKKLTGAIRAKTLPKKALENLLDEALEKSVITKEEFKQVKEAEDARFDALQVDEFSQKSMIAKELKSLVK